MNRNNYSALLWKSRGDESSPEMTKEEYLATLDLRSELGEFMAIARFSPYAMNKCTIRGCHLAIEITIDLQGVPFETSVARLKDITAGQGYAVELR